MGFGNRRRFKWDIWEIRRYSDMMLIRERKKDVFLVLCECEYKRLGRFLVDNSKDKCVSKRR